MHFDWLIDCVTDLYAQNEQATKRDHVSHRKYDRSKISSYYRIKQRLREERHLRVENRFTATVEIVKLGLNTAEHDAVQHSLQHRQNTMQCNTFTTASTEHDAVQHIHYSIDRTRCSATHSLQHRQNTMQCNTFTTASTERICQAISTAQRPMN